MIKYGNIKFFPAGNDVPSAQFKWNKQENELHVSSE